MSSKNNQDIKQIAEFNSSNFQFQENQSFHDLFAKKVSNPQNKQSIQQKNSTNTNSQPIQTPQNLQQLNKQSEQNIQNEQSEKNQNNIQTETNNILSNLRDYTQKHKNLMGFAEIKQKIANISEIGQKYFTSFFILVKFRDQFLSEIKKKIKQDFPQIQGNDNFTIYEHLIQEDFDYQNDINILYQIMQYFPNMQFFARIFLEQKRLLIQIYCNKSPINQLMDSINNIMENEYEFDAINKLEMSNFFIHKIKNSVKNSNLFLPTQQIIKNKDKDQQQNEKIFDNEDLDESISISDSKDDSYLQSQQFDQQKQQEISYVNKEYELIQKKHIDYESNPKNQFLNYKEIMSRLVSFSQYLKVQNQRKGSIVAARFFMVASIQNQLQQQNPNIAIIQLLQDIQKLLTEYLGKKSKSIKDQYQISNRVFFQEKVILICFQLLDGKKNYTTDGNILAAIQNQPPYLNIQYNQFYLNFPKNVSMRVVQIFPYKDQFTQDIQKDNLKQLKKKQKSNQNQTQQSKQDQFSNIQQNNEHQYNQQVQEFSSPIKKKVKKNSYSQNQNQTFENQSKNLDNINQNQDNNQISENYQENFQENINNHLKQKENKIDIQQKKTQKLNNQQNKHKIYTYQEIMEQGIIPINSIQGAENFRIQRILIFLNKLKQINESDLNQLEEQFCQIFQFFRNLKQRSIVVVYRDFQIENKYLICIDEINLQQNAAEDFIYFLQKNVFSSYFISNHLQFDLDEIYIQTTSEPKLSQIQNLQYSISYENFLYIQNKNSQQSQKNLNDSILNKSSHTPKLSRKQSSLIENSGQKIQLKNNSLKKQKTKKQFSDYDSDSDNQSIFNYNLRKRKKSNIKNLDSDSNLDSFSDFKEKQSKKFSQNSMEQDSDNLTEQKEESSGISEEFQLNFKRKKTLSSPQKNKKQLQKNSFKQIKSITTESEKNSDNNYNSSESENEQQNFSQKIRRKSFSSNKQSSYSYSSSFSSLNDLKELDYLQDINYNLKQKKQNFDQNLNQSQSQISDLQDYSETDMENQKNQQILKGLSDQDQSYMEEEEEVSENSFDPIQFDQINFHSKIFDGVYDLPEIEKRLVRYNDQIKQVDPKKISKSKRVLLLFSYNKQEISNKQIFYFAHDILKVFKMYDEEVDRLQSYLRIFENEQKIFLDLYQTNFKHEQVIHILEKIIQTQQIPQGININTDSYFINTLQKQLPNYKAFVLEHQLQQNLNYRPKYINIQPTENDLYNFQQIGKKYKRQIKPKQQQKKIKHFSLSRQKQFQDFNVLSDISDDDSEYVQNDKQQVKSKSNKKRQKMDKNLDSDQDQNNQTSSNFYHKQEIIGDQCDSLSDSEILNVEFGTNPKILKVNTKQPKKNQKSLSLLERFQQISETHKQVLNKDLNNTEKNYLLQNSQQNQIDNNNFETENQGNQIIDTQDSTNNKNNNNIDNIENNKISSQELENHNLIKELCKDYKNFNYTQSKYKIQVQNYLKAWENKYDKPMKKYYIQFLENKLILTLLQDDSQEKCKQQAKILQQLGKTYYLLPNLEKAKECFYQAAEIYRQIDSYLILKALFQVGKVLIRQKMNIKVKQEQLKDVYIQILYLIVEVFNKRVIEHYQVCLHILKRLVQFNIYSECYEFYISLHEQIKQKMNNQNARFINLLLYEVKNIHCKTCIEESKFLIVLQPSELGVTLSEKKKLVMNKRYQALTALHGLERFEKKIGSQGWRTQFELGQVYFWLSRYTRAEKHVVRSLQYLNDMNKEVDIQSAALGHINLLIKIYGKLKESQLEIKYLEKKIKILKILNPTSEILMEIKQCQNRVSRLRE